MSRRTPRPERRPAAKVSPPDTSPTDAPATLRTRLPVLASCLLVFAVALVLRLIGIRWGLPGSDRFFSYHPDESVVVLYSSALNPLFGRLDPGFYNYGSLSLLLNSIAILVGEAFGLAGKSPVSGLPPPEAYLAARLVTALLGSGTTVFLVLAGREMWNLRAGAVAGLLYAVAPLAVQHGHFATVDVPATFWICGALYFAARFLSHAKTRDLVWCGLWSGLAAATKYNAGLVALAGVAAWWLVRPRTAKDLGALVLAAAGGFVIGCPAILLNPGGLIGGILFEARHVSEGHGLVFAGTAPALIYNAVFNLRWGLGLPLLLLSAAGLVAALVRRGRGDLLLLAFLIPYYLLIGMAQVKFARYSLPIFPPLLLLVGALITLPANRKARIGATAAGSLAAVYALLMSAAFVQAMSGTDPRDEAARFLRARQPQTVGFATGPWWYSPPLAPGLAAFNPWAAKEYAGAATQPRLVPALKEWDVELLRSSRPDAVALSEFEYTDPLRLRRADALTYISEMNTALPRREVFARPLQVFGIPFTNIDLESGLPSQHLPHDMLYTNATVVVHYR